MVMIIPLKYTCNYNSIIRSMVYQLSMPSRYNIRSPPVTTQKMAVHIVASGSAGLQLAIGLKLIPYLRARIEEWEGKSKNINILVTGKTGVGKSTLVNGIVGREVAEQGDTLDPETSEVTAHTTREGDITVNVFDSPGLQDGTKNEARYLADMKQKCADVDLVVYCIRMSEPRVPEGGPDIKAIRLLNETFGHDMWKNTVFLLTFANDIVESAELEADDLCDQQRYFNEDLQSWETLIHEWLHITVGVPKEIVDGIIIIPAGHKNKPLLPDSASVAGESHWLSRVWLKALAVTKPQAQLALIKLNLHRIHTNESEYEHDGDIVGELISKHKLVFSEKGADIGKSLGIPAGEMVGELAGILTGRESFIDSLVLHVAIKAGIIRPEELNDIKG